MSRETLAGGAVRFNAPAISFVFDRLRPGVLLTAARGRDAGELGTAPLDYVDQEYRRFGRPVRWCFDASQVTSAAGAVSAQWAEWLSTSSDRLAHLHILTGTGSANLTINVARHFSGASARITVHDDRDAWVRGLQQAVPGLTDLPDLAQRFDEAPLAVTRENISGGTRATTPDCSWSFVPLAPGRLFSEFKGADSGDLSDFAFDELESAIARGPGKLRWFIDLREARHVSPRVSRTWTEWLARNRANLARITALSPSALFPLVLTVASFQAGTEDQLDIHRDEATFAAALQAPATSSTEP